MDFPLSGQLSPHLQYVAETGSTNADLMANSASATDFSVLVAGYQSAGRGRSGRSWEAPAGSSLFVSVLLKPSGVSPNQFSWLPLMAGLAMAQTVASLLPDNDVSLKWPNDVLVAEKKISGVLSELIPNLSGVIIGAGLNISQQAKDLPIENATSISLEGGAATMDVALAEYLKNLRKLYESYLQHGGNAVASGLRQLVIANCSTLNRDGKSKVRAILPGDKELVGNAIGIDDTGRLILQPENSDQVTPISAGDIVHLRHN